MNKGIMYSYRIVYKMPDKNEINKYIECSEYYVAKSFKKITEIALDFADKTDYELIAIIKLNPILKVWKR